MHNQNDPSNLFFFPINGIHFISSSLVVFTPFFFDAQQQRTAYTYANDLLFISRTGIISEQQQRNDQSCVFFVKIPMTHFFLGDRKFLNCTAGAAFLFFYKSNSSRYIQKREKFDGNDLVQIFSVVFFDIYIIHFLLGELCAHCTYDVVGAAAVSASQ